MNNTIIRKMEERDIDSVLKIEKESFTTPWSRNAFEMEVKKNNLATYIVAEKDGKVVGYGGQWVIIDEAHITNIAVALKYRGEGIGNIIVEGLLDIAKDKGLARITLEVRKSNYIAQALYKKYGFSKAGVRRGYYSDTKEDAIIMWKEL